MKRFEGKTALITGAARGIGRGIALCLAEEGANIVVNDCANIEGAEEVVRNVQAMGPEALFWQADVSDRQAVTAMFAGVVEQFGRIDVVVSNAARSIREPVVEAKWEHVLSTLEVTQFGVLQESNQRFLMITHEENSLKARKWVCAQKFDNFKGIQTPIDIVANIEYYFFSALGPAACLRNDLLMHIF